MPKSKDSLGVAEAESVLVIEHETEYDQEALRSPESDLKFQSKTPAIEHTKRESTEIQNIEDLRTELRGLAPAAIPEIKISDETPQERIARLQIIIPEVPDEPLANRLKRMAALGRAKLGGFFSGEKRPEDALVDDVQSNLYQLRYRLDAHNKKKRIRELENTLPILTEIFYNKTTPPDRMVDATGALVDAFELLREKEDVDTEILQGKIVESLKIGLQNLGRILLLSSPDYRREMIRALHKLGRHTSWKDIRSVIADQIEAVLPAVSDYFESSGGAETKLEEVCHAYGMSDSVYNEAQKSLDRKIAADIGIAGGLFKSPFGRAQELGTRAVENAIPETLADKRAVLMERWKDSAGKYHWEAREAIRKNLKIIDHLENEEPGSARELFETFGISVFGRYPREVLLAQYRERDLDDRPYGIVMNAYHDWNGSFWREGETIDHSGITRTDLYEQLAANTSTTHRLRIVEAGSKVDIGRRLLTMQKKYPDHRIAFAIVGAHANETVMHFGPGHTKESFVQVEDLFGKGVRRTGSFFEEGAPVVLSACKTGLPQAIGQRISQELKLNIIAPDADTSLQAVSVEYLDGKISLHPTYKDATLNQYQKGEKIESSLAKKA